MYCLVEQLQSSGYSKDMEKASSAANIASSIAILVGQLILISNCQF